MCLNLLFEFEFQPMNYFDLYELPVLFVVDKQEVRSKFYALSKKYHPDFYTLESEEKQAEILELSTLNNEAYKVLSDDDQRMKYVLDLNHLLDEEGKTQIPQDFLMEMMEVNEALMELEFDFDAGQFSALQDTLTSKETALYQQVQPILNSYKHGLTPDTELESVKSYYYKKRYLLRIRENLDKFVPR